MALTDSSDEEPAFPFQDDAILTRALSDESQMRELFRVWKKQFCKSYSTKEERKERYEIFKDSALRVYETNRISGRNATALNHFADFTRDELRKYLGKHRH